MKDLNRFCWGDFKESVRSLIRGLAVHCRTVILTLRANPVGRKESLEKESLEKEGSAAQGQGEENRAGTKRVHKEGILICNESMSGKLGSCCL